MARLGEWLADPSAEAEKAETFWWTGFNLLWRGHGAWVCAERPPPSLSLGPEFSAQRSIQWILQALTPDKALQFHVGNRLRELAEAFPDSCLARHWSAARFLVFPSCLELWRQIPRPLEHHYQRLCGKIRAWPPIEAPTTTDTLPPASPPVELWEPQLTFEWDQLQPSQLLYWRTVDPPLRALWTALSHEWRLNEQRAPAFWHDRVVTRLLLYYCFRQLAQGHPLPSENSELLDAACGLSSYL